MDDRLEEARREVESVLERTNDGLDDRLRIVSRLVVATVSKRQLPEKDSSSQLMRMTKYHRKTLRGVNRNDSNRVSQIPRSLKSLSNMYHYHHHYA